MAGWQVQAYVSFDIGLAMLLTMIMADHERRWRSYHR